MDGQTGRRTDEWMNGQTDRHMDDGWMDGWQFYRGMDRQLDGWMMDRKMDYWMDIRMTRITDGRRDGWTNVVIHS